MFDATQGDSLSLDDLPSPQRDIQFRDYEGQPCSMKHWLRSEWLRSGLPLYKTNDACGVKNAATRKYFTQCYLWYFPSPDKMEELARYANKYGSKDR